MSRIWKERWRQAHDTAEQTYQVLKELVSELAQHDIEFTILEVRDSVDVILMNAWKNFYAEHQFQYLLWKNHTAGQWLTDFARWCSRHHFFKSDVQLRVICLYIILCPNLEVKS